MDLQGLSFAGCQRAACGEEVGSGGRSAVRLCRDWRAEVTSNRREPGRERKASGRQSGRISRSVTALKELVGPEAAFEGVTQHGA